MTGPASQVRDGEVYDAEAAVPRDDQVTDEIPLPSASGSERDAVAREPDAGTRGGGGDRRDEALLEMSGVRSGYGQVPVLHGIDLAVGEGETAVLLGLNGAGKTTTAMAVCGALRTWSGTIRCGGQDVTSASIGARVRQGIVMVPEGRRVFPDLSVDRNLQIGGWTQRRDHDWVADQRDRVLGYFPRLRERLGQLAGTLSGGEQQMLAIARGLMARPRLLIIDEASMGLAPVIVRDVFDIVRRINEDGVTVLLIEQNVGALQIADVGIMMQQGHVLRELRGDELRDRRAVSEMLIG